MSLSLNNFCVFAFLRFLVFAICYGCNCVYGCDMGASVVTLLSPRGVAVEAET